MKINKDFIGIFLIIFCVSISLFVQFKSPYYYLAVAVALFGFINRKKINFGILRIYILILVLTSTSILGGFYDFKNLFNQLAFLFISYYVATSKAYSINYLVLQNYFRVLIFVLCLVVLYGYSIAVFDVIDFDFNTYYRKVYDSVGLFKQEFGQLLAICLISLFLYAKNLKYKISLYSIWVIIVLMIPLLVGARSIFFGFMCLLIVYSLKRKFAISLLSSSFAILLFHLIFPFALLLSSFKDLFYQFDPRWGMQYISVTESLKHPLGIGFFGWDEYVIVNSRTLYSYIEYLPIMMGYIQSEYIPTTLESSFFQFLIEIGIPCTLILYYLLFRISWRLLKNDLTRFEFAILNSFIVITFSSFYEDNLFQPIWHIVLGFTLMIYIKYEKIH